LKKSYRSSILWLSVCTVSIALTLAQSSALARGRGWNGDCVAGGTDNIFDLIGDGLAGRDQIGTCYDRRSGQVIVHFRDDDNRHETEVADPDQADDHFLARSNCVYYGTCNPRRARNRCVARWNEMDEWSRPNFAQYCSHGDERYNYKHRHPSVHRRGKKALAAAWRKRHRRHHGHQHASQGHHRSPREGGSTNQ
jgi:hypothetical protein